MCPLLHTSLFISIHLMLLFIRDSLWRGSGCDYISIHLMLLFISKIRGTGTGDIDFNTSHVTVYRCFFRHVSHTNVIFQYISCYCLSGYWHEYSNKYRISIHLMLLFITQNHHSSGGLNRISIHLMLLFINGTLLIFGFVNLFQYISCYCLSAH